MSEGSGVRGFLGAIIFVICFVIACMFLYWAVEYYVYNSFDKNRYSITKLQVGNSDSLAVWKLDNRTGILEYCSKSYDRIDQFVCVRATTLEAKDYRPEAPAPVATHATDPAAPLISSSPSPTPSTAPSPQPTPKAP